MSSPPLDNLLSRSNGRSGRFPAQTAARAGFPLKRPLGPVDQAARAVRHVGWSADGTREVARRVNVMLVVLAGVVATAAAVRSTWSPCGQSMLSQINPI